MQIGLDAAALKNQPHGIGNYIKNLVLALPTVAPEEQYSIFLPRRNIRQFSSLTQRVCLEPCPSSRFFRVLWEQAALPWILKVRKVDVFHGLASAVPPQSTCPSVVTIHDLTTHIMPKQHTAGRSSYLRWMIPQSCRRADAIIAVSESTRRDLVSVLQVPSKKIVVIPLGVDDSFHKVLDPDVLFAVRRKYNLPEEYILYLGVIEPRKNLGNLVRAYQQAADIHEHVPLVLAGSLGWGYKPLLREITESPVRDRVFLSGHIQQEDLAAVYSAASLFVYPSLYEGFGLPVLEAMACGTPVITSNIASLPEVAGEAAILVDPHSPHDIAEAIRRVLAHPDLRQQLSQRGVLRARSFRWDYTARQTHHVYAQLLG